MKRSRFRLILAIMFITLYMLSALVWWAFALTRNQEKIHQEEIAQIELKKEWAEDFAYHSIKSNPHLPTENSVILGIQKETLIADTQRLKVLIEQKFPELHVNYMTIGQRDTFSLCLYTDTQLKSELDQTLRSKKRAWVLEGITLGLITLIIAAAMFFYVDKIIRLNAQQNNFLLAVTHELKTPISATKLALQTMKKNPEPMLGQKLIEMAGSNILRLSRMVDQILLSTKFESKFIDPVFTNCNLKELVAQSIEGLELPPEKRNLIEVSIQDDIFFEADESMMTMVFRNLITNALKYGDDKPVMVSAEKIGSNFKICFSDGGIGISDLDKKRIFEKFYRVGEEKTRTQPGSGLGLYLVKKITEIHSGKVSVSDNKPAGTKFILTFYNNKQ